jgi:hypothetical protein
LGCGNLREEFVDVAAVQKHGPHDKISMKTLLIQHKTNKAVLAIHLREFIEADSFFTKQYFTDGEEEVLIARINGMPPTSYVFTGTGMQDSQPGRPGRRFRSGTSFINTTHCKTIQCILIFTILFFEIN